MKKGKTHLKLVFLGLGILAVLALWLGLSDRGFVRLYKMEIERQNYLDKIEILKKENLRLMKEIERLRHDPSYIERLAREELGLVKNDEIIYRFKSLDKPVDKKINKSFNGDIEKNSVSGR